MSFELVFVCGQRTFYGEHFEIEYRPKEENDWGFNDTAYTNVELGVHILMAPTGLYR